MKVLILIVHYGEWPSWFEYFLLSCKKNQHINWLLLSDSKEPENHPENVAFASMDPGAFNALASKKLGLKIAITNPYKLCDLRPAYGTIFKDFIGDMDFWGYSDLDLVYGDFTSFLTQEVLKGYDLISCRKDYLAGHFALYRNTKEMNELFKRSPAYLKIFTDNQNHFAFDEISNFYGRRLFENPQNSNLKKLYSSIELFLNKFRYHLSFHDPVSLRDMNSITHFAEKAGKIKVYREDIVKSDLWYIKNMQPDWMISWENGKLSDTLSTEELLHFHFLRSKHEAGFMVEPLGKAESFIISPKGFRPK